MFFNYIKELLAKKIVKKSLSNVKLSSSDGLIKTVGILFDETYFYEKNDLIEELVKEGILESNIKVLVFKNKIKKTEVFDYPVFSYNNLTWNGNIDKIEVQQFINESFDLLINYYDIEKAALLVVSQSSKAKFEVGFSAVDKRLNHFMIDTSAENYKVFINELFKYLRILNKI